MHIAHWRNTFAFMSALSLLLWTTATPALSLDKKILGSWSASPKCDDDMIVHIKRKEYSGWEFYCTILTTKPEKGGWRALMQCNGEGEQYSQNVHWCMLKNGRLRHSVAGRKTVEMRRCSG